MLSRRAFSIGAALACACATERGAHAAVSPRRFVPVGKGPFPLVVIVHDVDGLADGRVDMLGNRLARGGHLAIAPQLFASESDVAKIADARVIDDLDAALLAAKTDSQAAAGRIGVMGFGWGGRMVWLHSAFGKVRPKAGVALGGALSNAQNAFQTRSPLDVAKQLKTPVLGLYHDRVYSPLAHVTMMQREIDPREPSRLERAQKAALDGDPALVRKLLIEHQESASSERQQVTERAGRSGVVLHSTFDEALEKALMFMSTNGV